MSTYWIILLGAGFLALWYTAHRVKQRDGDAHADAYASLKKLVVALLLLFALVAMQLLAGAAVWFAVGHFFPTVSNEWRTQMAIAAAMMVWGLLFAAPWKVSLRGGNK